MGFCFQKYRQNSRTRFMYFEGGGNKIYRLDWSTLVFQNAFYSDFVIITALGLYVF
jgi:hypothetical protein